MPTSSALAVPAVLGALGALTAGYAAVEARRYTVRRVDLPVLPEGMRQLRVLHVSDIHMLPGQQHKQEWLGGLAALEPDFVINTGDNLSHQNSVPVVADALGSLLDRPGVFVHGSNDYFAPTLRNPLRYLLPDDGRRNTNAPSLPWPELSKRFTDAGWLDLTNARTGVKVGETSLAFAGVDDPHLGYDRLDLVAGPADATADIRLGVTHAPYLRVLDQYARDGYDAVIAGHTHGGQVCLPGGRALTTNCDLDTKRARGLHRHPAESEPGDKGSSWLHVSAGIGTAPHVRLRLACRPEATLLTLTNRT